MASAATEETTQRGWNENTGARDKNDGNQEGRTDHNPFVIKAITILFRLSFARTYWNEGPVVYQMILIDVHPLYDN